MKCSRQSNKTFWTNVGRQYAAKGYTLEFSVSQLREGATAAKSWLAEGWEAQTKRAARLAKSAGSLKP